MSIAGVDVCFEDRIMDVSLNDSSSEVSVGLWWRRNVAQFEAECKMWCDPRSGLQAEVEGSDAKTMIKSLVSLLSTDTIRFPSAVRNINDFS